MSDTKRKEKQIAADLLPSSMPGQEYKIAIGFPRNISGKAVLDIGSGASDCVNWLRSAGAKAYGIDFRYRNREHFLESSRLSLQKVAARLGGSTNAMAYMDAIRHSFSIFLNNFHPSAPYAAAYASQLPFPDGSFDFVFSINCLTHGLDQDFYVFRDATTEAIRVLKPDGELQAYPFLGAMGTNFKKNHRKLLDYLKGEGFDAIPEPATSFYDRLRVRKH